MRRGSGRLFRLEPNSHPENEDMHVASAQECPGGRAGKGVCPVTQPDGEDETMKYYQSVKNKKREKESSHTDVGGFIGHLEHGISGCRMTHNEHLFRKEIYMCTYVCGRERERERDGD